MMYRRRSRWDSKLYWLSGAAFGKLAFWLVVAAVGLLVMTAMVVWRAGVRMRAWMSWTTGVKDDDGERRDFCPGHARRRALGGQLGNHLDELHGQ
jgi:hypothetical protein